MSNVNVKSGWGTGESWTTINLNADELSVCVGLAAEQNLKMKANIEAHEIKYNALEIAERPDKYIEFQREVDRQQLMVLQKTIIRNFIVSIPPSYKHLVQFDDWDSAMNYLTKHFKRRSHD